MGVECKTDNNNVITTTCGSMRTQLASASAQSSPPARHRKARMAACLSSVSAGEDRATVRSSLAARDSLGTRGVGPDAGIEVEKAERRISAGGFNRHKLLSGDTRLLAARSPPSPAATPTKRVSREKTGSSVSTQPPPSGKSLVKRRPTIDFTKSASGCQNKTSTKSGVPVRKSNSTAEKRKSLPPGAVRASEAPSVTLRPTASQNRLRPKSLGSESLAAAVTSHARREAAATVKPLTQTVTRGAPRPSTTMRTSISTRLSEKWTPGGGDASKITSVSIATSLSASLASTTDMPPPSATADSVQHAGERDEDESNSTHHHQRHSHHHNHHGRSPVKESRKGEEEKTKDRHREKRKEGEKKLEAERRVRRADHERAKIDEKRKSAREKTPGGEKKRTPQEEEKRRSLEDKERRERRRLAERENRRSAEKERRRSKEKSASPEKRNKEENRKKRERSQDKDNVSRAIPLGKRISTSSSTSSTSGGNSRMVQQKGSSNGDGEEGAPGRAELERRERIQRYKDERRKQMAARYGQVEWSSSEESGAGEETYSAYRRRRRRGGRDTNTSSNTDLSTHEAPRLQENGSPPEGRGRRVVGGSSSEDVVVSAGVGVRSTRTSRLRQAALASSSTTNNNNNNNNNNYNSASSNNNNNNIYAEGVGERGRGEASPDLAPLKRLPDQAEGRMCVDSADSPLSGSDGRGGRRHAGSSDKDKSHKRKSNLNRSTTSEVLPPTSDPLPAAQHNDSNEDTPRRRRRRGPLSPVGGGGGLSVSGAEPLKTPEVVRHVVSRLTPPVTAPTQPSALSSSQQPSLQSSAPAHTFQPIQPAAIPDSTHSAPSTLDSRARHAQDCGSRRLSGSLGNETEEGVRKVPPKLAPLKKPDIPDVLRPKDATSLASPGVVNTPPSSRPSSVVFDKPPLGPEGQRPVTLRTSLRKPTDIGTCFMAARREKRDDSKPENVFRDQLQRPKKGDRLSQSDMNLKIESSFSGKQDDLLSPGSSDLEVACISASSLTTATSSPALGSEEVMSSRLEALTARAKETMERADRLGKDSTPPPPESSPPEDSADSMVHECEQYLTVNAGRKELSGGVRPREVVSSEARSDNIQSPTVKKGVISDTGQKNWVGGSEGRGKESKRLAMEKEVNKEMKREPSQAAEPLKMTAASAVPSGPPDLATLGSDNLSPPPEEVVHGLRHVGYADEDVGSPESVQMRSPDHRSSSSSSGSKRSSRRCSLDGDTPQAVSPDPQSILKRRSSREDVTVERPTTPEPHSILKRKTSSRTSSIDIVEGEPRPILKKKSSVEELDHFEPRPILKKKSSTDDELDDRPRSILKGGRSREDLDLTEGFVSPNPILKRSPRCDSEGEGELRPILKRRDTTDGVRLRLHVSDGEDVEGEVPSVRVRSDSAPEAVIRLRGHSPPALSATPSHGILKKRGAHSPGRFDQMDSELGAILRSRRTQGVSDADSDSEATNRPQSPSLLALTKREESSSRSGERPLSVAERVAGMEAARQEPPPPAACRSPTPTRSPGARPKQTPSFLDRPPTPTEKGRDNRRNSAFALVAEPSPGDGTEAINEAFLDRPVTEAYNSAIFPNDDAAPTTPSVVSQKAAFFAQLEREQKTSPDTSPSRPGHTSRFSSRRDRGTRHATQPVTEEEVNQASRLAEASDSASHDSDSAAPRRESSSGFRAAREAVLRNSAEVMQGLTPGSSPRRRSSSRKTSVNEPEEDLSLDPVRGILKRDGSGGSREVPRDSPRSILKHFSDARRSSFSESEHPRGILKSESPLPPPIGSPEHEAKLLRGVLKKDSSLEDSKEIKSILKPESQSLERDHSSDSSSDDVTLTTGNAAQGPECDIADSIRDIDPVRHKDDQYKGDVPHKADPYKTEHHRADLAEALRHVEPIKSRDDLAEALRQIEPIHSKERSREREDRGREESLSVSVREFSSTSKVTTTMGTMVATASVPPQAPAVTNSSSSTSENELKIIKNEAIMRRKTNHARKYDERRSMVELRSIERATDVSSLAHQDASESSSSSSSESSEGQVKTSTTTATTTTTTRSYIGSDMDASQILRQSPIFRNKTSSPSPEQGIGEKASLRNASPASQTINARLAALQKSGEDGWKNRVKKDDKDFNSNVTLRPKPLGGHRERPVSLMDRMSALATSSQQWKGRVTQSDATKFTVAHKMASASTSSVPSLVSGMSTGVTRSPEQLLTPTGSPHLERKKRSPCQKIFKSKTGGNIPSLANKSSPSSPRKNFRRSISTPQDSERKAEAPEGTSVSVPQVDDDSFNAFFSKVPDSVSLNSEDAPELNEADFDHISVTASQLVVKRRSVRVARRQVASRNPLKALAAREDIKSEYVEVKMGTGEKELRRMKVEELSKSSSLAVEALAGLASRENFSAVALKKVENSPVVREMPPYTSLMLLHVKGRRHAQTRLVEPIAANINQGDDFVLITPSEIYHYKGEFANVIERAKAAEIAQYILQKKDMGVASATTIVEVTEHSPSSRKAKFWKHLGGDEKSEAKPAGLPEEDEYVEAALVAANKVYEVQEDSLVPLPDSWGQMPKIEILSSDKVLVLDFGSELYIWAGKRGCGDNRRIGVALGRELWEEEYDYTECDINPITPMMPMSKAKLKGTRPDWGLCAKLTENVETILFKEKFIDWPDLAQQSRIKEVKKELDRYVAPVCELQPCDAKMMLEELPLEPDLILEMSHLGRGVEYYDEEERRLLSISTNDFKVWHVSEYGKVLMSETSRCHLFTGDSYVVRWYYHVTATGRTLKGEPSKHNVTGRSRVAYFFWQGRDSSVSDKGVSALMTVELDEERGPHIRVSMGSEPPAFLNLFKGGLIVHQGHQDEEHENKDWRMFMVRGELENEGHLVEIDVNSQHLRSRGCLVLANLNTGVIHLWLGAKALKGTRDVGNTTAQKLMETPDSSIGWKSSATKKIKKQYEGAESRDFWEAFGGSKNNHFSLLDDEHSYDWTPRIWHLEAKHDSFQATEITCSYRATSTPNPLPVLQSELYSAKQPALFMVDSGHRVWVWQGWWPDESSDGDEFSATGSAVLRFNFARRAALQTALNYCQLKAKSQAKSLAAKSYKKTEVEVAAIEPQLVVAGMEPSEFTNVFPIWTPRPDVIAIQEKEGRWMPGGQYLVDDILAQLSRTRYSLAELTIKPLPDGVDPLHLEVYLSPEEFTEALGMNQDEFYSLQNWKQTEIKKKAKLF